MRHLDTVKFCLVLVCPLIAAILAFRMATKPSMENLNGVCTVLFACQVEHPPPVFEDLVRTRFVLS